MKPLNKYIQESVLDITDQTDMIQLFFNGVDTIDSKLLRSLPNAEEIEELVIPEGVEHIADNAFFNAYDHLTKLHIVTLPSTLRSIGRFAFLRFYSLREVRWSGNPKDCEIGEKAFMGCKKMSSIDLPEGITSIGKFCFSDCDSLKEVTIPASLQTIGEDIFNPCKNLQKVTISDGIKEVGINMFNTCPKLTSITLPQSVETINRGAFFMCKGLKSIKAPGVTHIGGICFSGCQKLSEIYWDGNGYIEDRAFEDCHMLRNIYVYSTKVDKEYIYDRIKPLRPNIIHK